jgi:hypothetical protein
MWRWFSLRGIELALCVVCCIQTCGLMAQQSTPPPPVPAAGDPMYAPIAGSGAMPLSLSVRAPSSRLSSQREFVWLILRMIIRAIGKTARARSVGIMAAS